MLSHLRPSKVKSKPYIKSSKKFYRIVWVQRQNPRSWSPIYSKRFLVDIEDSWRCTYMNNEWENKLNNDRNTKRTLNTLSRSCTKKVRKACYGYQRYELTALNNPPPGELPEDRTVGSRRFEVIGVEYAEQWTTTPIWRRTLKHLLFLCSLTRAVHIQAIQSQTTNKFIWALKLLIAQQGKLSKIYSGNAQTFVSGSE